MNSLVLVSFSTTIGQLGYFFNPHYMECMWVKEITELADGGGEERFGMNVVNACGIHSKPLRVSLVFYFLAHNGTHPLLRMYPISPTQAGEGDTQR